MLMLLGFVVFNFLGPTIAITHHGYMTHYFYNHKPIFVNDSMIIELTNRPLPDMPDDDYLTCDVVIETAKSRRLLIHFLSLEISDAEEIDRLRIYDYSTNEKEVQVSPPEGLYGQFDSYYTGMSRRLSDYMSTGNKFRLDYQGRPTLAYDGFKILVTSFKDARGSCSRGFIKCARKGICIPMSTWCDDNRNCGNNDNSDEARCNHGLGDEWQPIDGQVTAIVAAITSFTVFVISVGVIALVIVRLNKRDIIQHNITVEFKKRRATKQTSTNNDTHRLYAPPSYEVVIGMDEDPPPYHSVYETESDEEDGVFRERIVEHPEEHEVRVISDFVSIPKAQNTGQCTTVKMTSALVTCDIEGNNRRVTSIDGACAAEGYMKQTNYKLCSTASSSLDPVNKNIKIVHNDFHSEIEVISSDDSDSVKDENKNRPKFSDSNDISNVPNGHPPTAKTNGHATKVAYKGNGTLSEDTVEFMDGE